METSINEENKDIKLNFLTSLNGTDTEKFEAKPDYFFNVISKEIDVKEALLKLGDAEQEKVYIKTVIVDSRLDFVSSTRNLQKIFNLEFERMIKILTEKYNAEIVLVKQLFRKELIGQGLISMVNAVSKAGWVLVMKENSVNLYKCYSPEYPVKEGFYEDGTIRDYDNVVTCLRGIYVNILHPKITSGTIYLAIDGGKHPNCEESHFGAACPGTLENREIPVTDSKALVSLLEEISQTYQRMHLDSAYHEPTGSYSERKEKPQWTA